MASVGLRPMPLPMHSPKAQTKSDPLTETCLESNCSPQPIPFSAFPSPHIDVTFD